MDSTGRYASLIAAALALAAAASAAIGGWLIETTGWSGLFALVCGVSAIAWILFAGLEARTKR